MGVIGEQTSAAEAETVLAKPNGPTTDEPIIDLLTRTIKNGGFAEPARFLAEVDLWASRLKDDFDIVHVSDVIPAQLGEYLDKAGVRNPKLKQMIIDNVKQATCIPAAGNLPDVVHQAREKNNQQPQQQRQQAPAYSPYPQVDTRTTLGAAVGVPTAQVNQTLPSSPTNNHHYYDQRGLPSPKQQHPLHRTLPPPGSVSTPPQSPLSPHNNHNRPHYPAAPHQQKHAPRNPQGGGYHHNGHHNNHHNHHHHGQQFKAPHQPFMQNAMQQMANAMKPGAAYGAQQPKPFGFGQPYGSPGVGGYSPYTPAAGNALVLGNDNLLNNAMINGGAYGNGALMPAAAGVGVGGLGVGVGAVSPFGGLAVGAGGTGALGGSGAIVVSDDGCVSGLGIADGSMGLGMGVGVGGCGGAGGGDPIFV
eukprot:TRINITY_DN22781_c0_g1_i1.p1 TRINITY_DN22781_c0_g1~~TRINITY_DN22781_c0_g1_i1.p1  ORF type:complete len:417 (+),score=71.20 TRINITY_DN22781_c0_g1_i1:65-1315(+)